MQSVAFKIKILTYVFFQQSCQRLEAELVYAKIRFGFMLCPFGDVNFQIKA
jgi:hypothetical protein